jgi:hypothetical protein
MELERAWKHAGRMRTRKCIELMRVIVLKVGSFRRVYSDDHIIHQISLAQLDPCRSGLGPL